MKKIRAAVVGYGNIGHYALQALEAAPDFEVAGVVRRNGAENKPEELAKYNVVKDIRELQDVDVAILATPTRSVEKYAKEILSLGINTVDSFDIHTQITSLRRSLDESAKAGKAVSVISAGWDPGSDSIVRAMLQAIAPKAITYTNFGPGMSSGTYRSRESRGRSESCPLHDHPHRHGHSPPHGIHRGKGRIRVPESSRCH